MNLWVVCRHFGLGLGGFWIWVLGLDPDQNPNPEFNYIHLGKEIKKKLKFFQTHKFFGSKKLLKNSKKFLGLGLGLGLGLMSGQGSVINYRPIIWCDWQSILINHNHQFFVPIQSYSNHNHFKNNSKKVKLNDY